MKYVVSYRTKFGTVSAESARPGDLVLAFDQLKTIAKKLDSPRNARGSRKARQIEKENVGTKGGGETTRILREMESKLLNSGFFSKPRTTGETKKSLLRISGQTFTSRKVSQALGILWKKRALKRVGKRNHYAYRTSP